MPEKEIAIVIPCYNEEKRLKSDDFIRFGQANQHIDLLFVNDGSCDSTLRVINDICRRLPGQTECLDLAENVGKAEAVRRGFLSAMSRPYRFIGFFDGDLSTPLDAVLSFYHVLQSSNAEIVLGSRVKCLGKKIIRDPSRHYFGRIFATFASMLLRMGVYDTQCGAKLFRNDAYLESVFSTPLLTKWAFDVEILMRYKLLLRKYDPTASLNSAYAVEYPLDYWRHCSGSKIKAYECITSGLSLIKIYLYYVSPYLSNACTQKFK